MTAPIEDVSSLPGDQQEVEIGEITDVYVAEDGFPMWVAVHTRKESGTGPGCSSRSRASRRKAGSCGSRTASHTSSTSPEVDAGDRISEDCDHALRTYYGIGAADQELWSDNTGYATLVPDEAAPASRAENVDELESPDPRQADR